MRCPHIWLLEGKDGVFVCRDCGGRGDEVDLIWAIAPLLGESGMLRRWLAFLDDRRVNA